MTPEEKDIALLEDQRRKYSRRMWRALEVLDQVDHEKADELMSAWDLERDRPDPGRRCVSCGGIYPATDREHVLYGDDPTRLTCRPRQTQVQGKSLDTKGTDK